MFHFAFQLYQNTPGLIDMTMECLTCLLLSFILSCSPDVCDSKEECNLSTITKDPKPTCEPLIKEKKTPCISDM